MPFPKSLLICFVLCAMFAAVYPGRAGADAASSYLFAALELDHPLPDYVESGTTDDPTHGFAVQLSHQQRSFLQQQSVVSVLVRFEHATSHRDCTWKRYTVSTWGDAGLNVRLHRLARIVLLRARGHYESGAWINGNRDVERVRIMARHMSLQARPFEHYCFMVENMATHTAAAFILRFPGEALADLSERNCRVGAFSPMSRMLTAEAQRIAALADNYEGGQVTQDQILSSLDPYLATHEQAQVIRGSAREAVRQLRGLCAFFDELSRLMDRDHQEAEERITRLYKCHAERNRLVAGLDGWPVEEYRENAQGVCRGMMFGAVIDRLRKGSDDFSNIGDPYGNKQLELRTADRGFTLVSDLTHHSRIDFRFGLACSEVPANQRPQPAGPAERPSEVRGPTILPNP